MDENAKKRLVEVNITGLSSKGNGLGYVQPADGIPYEVEVPFTMPGDKVRAFVVYKRRNKCKAVLEEILEPSAERIAARCIHFATCGGCRWQHIEYQKQLQHKEAYIRHCFASLLSHEITVYPIIPCSPPWNYRNKMEFTFSSNRLQEHFLGLIKDSSKGKVFNLTECHLVNGWFAEAVKTVRQWWEESKLDAFHPFRNTGSLRTLTVREGLRTGDRMVILTVSGNPDFALKKHDLTSFVAFIRDAIEPTDPDCYLSIFLRIQQTAKGMATNFYEMQLYGPDHMREILYIALDPEKKPLSLMFKISPVAFFQPNTKQAEQLYSRALQLLPITKETVVYDLYCGTGTLGICAAKLAKQVIGIELSPEATLDAKNNVAANGFENVEIICGPVSESLQTIRREEKLPKPDIIMLDPPRAGLDVKAIQEVLLQKPACILYISCNPVTQADNIASLLANGDYRMRCLQPVDQFPQTVHIENIAILERI